MSFERVPVYVPLGVGVCRHLGQFVGVVALVAYVALFSTNVLS